MTSKQRTALVDSAILGGSGVDSIDKQLQKRHNIDPLLMESPLVIYIVDNDVSRLLEGVKQGTEELSYPSRVAVDPSLGLVHCCCTPLECISLAGTSPLDLFCRIRLMPTSGPIMHFLSLLWSCLTFCLIPIWRMCWISV